MKFDLLETALLLGGIAFLAGCYGLLYGVGRLAQRQSIMLAGFACYAFLCVLVAVIVSTTPLAGPWKAIVLVFSEYRQSHGGFWNVRTHIGGDHDRKRAQYPGWPLARLRIDFRAFLSGNHPVAIYRCRTGDHSSGGSRTSQRLFRLAKCYEHCACSCSCFSDACRIRGCCSDIGVVLVDSLDRPHCCELGALGGPL